MEQWVLNKSSTSNKKLPRTSLKSEHCSHVGSIGAIKRVLGVI